VAGKPRIVIVGAGGWTFPAELSRDILSFPSLADGTLVLYDIDVPAAERTASAVRQLAGIAGRKMSIEVPGSLADAVSGADFVVTVFQVGGVRAYAHDIEIPREYGIDQTVGDTLGPGGVFRGLRTIEALRVIAETMLDVCPGALLLNYTNPMSANVWATDLLGVPIAGLCHSVANTAELLARELGVPLGEVTFDSAGVNHTAWFTTFRRGEADLIPRIREVMTARYVTGTMPMLPRSDDPYESNERVRTELMQLTGFFHTESSHHASEYWAWFRKTPELTRHYLDRNWDNLEVSRAADKEASDAEIVEEARREGVRHGGELAAPIMDSVLTGTPRTVHVNVRNGGSVTNLPADACVEVACLADARGIRPGRYGELPAACAALNEVQIAVQRLTVQAAMTGNRELVHAAVALDPLTSAVQTLPKIREMVEAMLAAEAEWLPQFSGPRPGGATAADREPQGLPRWPA
jgi:alpha-galactosidase